ncbi:MAG: hypothetical protein IJ263_02775 [Paludibacteraceae bacterium]|nr:hypothetical protein [Paludibacteraceae bacterium]
MSCRSVIALIGCWSGRSRLVSRLWYPSLVLAVGAPNPLKCEGAEIDPLTFLVVLTTAVSFNTFVLVGFKFAIK